MKKKNSLKDFYILWSTQSLSQRGSSITGFALTLWLYEKTGSALSTAALTTCSYAPYVLMSILAGELPAFMFRLFGSGKGSGTALMMFILGIAGIVLCLVMGRLLKSCKYQETEE